MLRSTTYACLSLHWRCSSHERIISLTGHVMWHLSPLVHRTPPSPCALSKLCPVSLHQLPALLRTALIASQNGKRRNGPGRERRVVCWLGLGQARELARKLACEACLFAVSLLWETDVGCDLHLHITSIQIHAFAYLTAPCKSCGKMVTCAVARSLSEVSPVGTI